MAWAAITCPQCSAPLPRVALWRAVKCSACGSLINRTESIVKRDTFRQALIRAREGTSLGHGVECGGERYHLMETLGRGEISEVYLAQKIGALPFLATIKLSTSPAAAKLYAQEALVLRELQALSGPAGAYFSMHLPLVMAQGAVDGSNSRQALVLQHANGFWGSLAALTGHFPSGLDPRHAVWIWRRILGVLSFVHDQGWSHGDVRPEHALVHPQDHGVRLIGWASAQKGVSAKDQAKDLMRSAAILLVLLNGANAASGVPGHVPTELAQLVTRASQDEAFCRTQRAEGLDSQLQSAAKAAFGPPSFVPLTI